MAALPVESRILTEARARYSADSHELALFMQPMRAFAGEVTKREHGECCLRSSLIVFLRSSLIAAQQGSKKLEQLGRIKHQNGRPALTWFLRSSLIAA